MADVTRIPGVMVSSTFFDLHQLRDDLRRFIQDEMGYRPLLSEHLSFPINPDATTVENCRERVERDADVLVLIIGKRYGSVDDRTSQSITNLEYLAARRKQIPIYAFVQRGIRTLLPVWRDNPMVKLSDIENPDLFRFVEQVQTEDRVWMQEFDNAQDIINALRIQFAYEHQRGLALAHRFRDVGDVWLDELKGLTLRLALEKPDGWEYRLFASALTDAIDRHRSFRRRHELRLPLGPGEDINAPMSWILARTADARRIVESLSTVINTTLQEGFGPPGVAGNVETIVFVAETIGDIYSEMLRWSARLQTANVEEDYRDLLRILSRWLDDAIASIQEYGPAVSAGFEVALARLQEEPSQTIVVERTLVIRIPEVEMKAFDTEFANLRARLGLGRHDA
ncbi:MAG TPA: DUF4062 domain-containing protein [Vicinamibacterales bacterium]|nr:DUF4062 domain-containing protein [Vicinamibacterales bacterium]